MPLMSGETPIKQEQSVSLPAEMNINGSALHLGTSKGGIILIPAS